jgi:hypothetical protein
MEEITCKAVRLNLWDYAAKVLPASENESVGSHLDACRECNRFLADTSSLHKGFRHLPEQALPPMLQTRLQVIASRERSRQYLRLDPTAWLRDKLADAMMTFDNFLKPYAVPATGGVLASCLCFSLIAHTLQLRPNLQFPTDEMPIGLFTEVAIDDVSPFTLPGKDVTMELTVNAKGQVTDFTPIPQPGSEPPTADEMNQIASFVLYSTFTPATRFGQPVASKRLFAIRHFLCAQDGDERECANGTAARD